MKKILVSLMLGCSMLAGATNYYVKVGGLVTNTGLSDAQAWNLAKVNSYFASFLPGDSILFKRGDTFLGTLQITRSGASGNHIIIAAYGPTTTTKPIITGFQSVSGWTNTSGNIWESAVTSAKSSLNIVSINGINTPMGRYPNPSAANGGYLTYESSEIATNIVDNQLAALPDWDGAEVVVRKNAWVIDRCLITDHSGTSVTFSGSSSYVGYNNWGYFIQNDLRTLDSQGEWFLNKTTKKLSIYTALNPSTLTIKASVYDTIVKATAGRSYITFSNLVIEGGGMYGVYWSAGTDVKLLDCDFRLIGKDAISNYDLSYLTVSRCAFSDINDNVLYGNGSSINAYFGYSTVTRCGIIPGNSGVGDGHNFGISLQASNSVAEYNKITKMGYIGILIAGNNTIARFNYVDSVCLTKDDGAGIYVSGALTTVMSGRIIRRNVVANSFGNLNGKASGTVAQANGIYVDGSGNNVLIDSNTVYNCTFGGVYLGFYTYNIQLTANTLMNNASQLKITENDIVDNNFAINGNVFASTTNQSLINFQSSAPAVERPISTLGTWAGNYYIKPFGNREVFTGYNKVSATRIEYKGVTTDGWAVYDASMHFAPVTITPYVVNSFVTSNQYVNGTFAANITGVRQFYYSGVSALSWDNTNQITAGTAKIALTTLGTQANVVDFAIPVNAVTVGKRYIVKFDIKGSAANKAVNVHLRSFITPYPYLMDYYNYYPVTNSATTVTVLLEPAVTATADVRIQVTDADLPAYVDNFEFYEADVSKANPADYITLFTNPTQSAKTVTFDGRYIDIYGSGYVNSASLNPYASKLLFKDFSYVPPVAPSGGSNGTDVLDKGKTVYDKGRIVRY